MDALKRAEEAKRQAHAGSTAEPTGLTLEEKSGKDANRVDASAPLDLVLEPDQLASTGHQSLPSIPQNLETLDHQFLDSVPPPQPRPAQSKSTATHSAKGPAPSSNPAAKPLTHAQQAAKSVFEAKQPARGTPVFFITVAVITLIAVACIGIYFWLQLQPKSGLLPAKSAAPQLAVPSVATQPPAVSPVPASAQAGSRALQAAEPERKVDIREAPIPVPPARPATQGRKRSALDELSGEPGGIRFRSSQPGIDPALMRGYELYQAGDRAGAKMAYEQALKNDANNLDALHGLGVLAVQNRQVEEAEYYFQRTLTVDPRDAVARAGLAALRNQSDPTNTESRLRSLLAEQPNSSQLNFALGNLLAANARWAEAQQAYFKAMATEPENPDVLFNLAVSLDHLHQAKLAADYYRKAVAAAANRPHQFDTGRANERIRALQP